MSDGMKATTMEATPESDAKLKHEFERKGFADFGLGVERDKSGYGGMLLAWWQDGWDQAAAICRQR